MPPRSPIVLLAAPANVVLGIWFAVSPYVLGYAGELRSELMALALGFLLFAFALVRAVFQEVVWLSWINGAQSVLAIMLPTMLQFGGVQGTNFIVVGVLGLVFALVATLATPPVPPEVHGHAPGQHP